MRHLPLTKTAPVRPSGAKIGRKARLSQGFRSMREDQDRAEAPQFLSGWKEIANYLGKGVRTVQRYEWQMGLPVRRPAGKPRAAVVATRKEIDAWVAASPIRQAFQLMRPVPGLPHETAVALKDGVKQMTRLGAQMRELRDEVRTSVDLLRQSIEDLHVGLIPDRWWVTIDSAKTLEESSRIQSLENFFAVDSKGRKAS
jgi:hypothetical protein